MCSVSEEYWGNIQYIGHITRQACHLYIASVCQCRSPVIQQEGANICLSPWIGI